ncbi:MAG: DUF4252 domain-containing protein [Lewinellaceae bacterium]|nr:DUF4252 domain-containing protein [Lewinella sp.]MCB9279097.1 DUF4252 domain-containing protein [Lewinellaceae bacterium]
MKIIRLLLIAMVMVPFAGRLSAQANAIDKYFQQYVDDERFTVVYISPKMFQLFEKMDIDDLDLDDDDDRIFLEVAKDMRGLRILTADENAAAFYKEAKAKINTTEYEPLITVRSKSKENVEFMIKEEGNKVSELLLLAGGDDSFVLLSFVGSFDLEKVTKMAKEMEKDNNNKIRKED